MKFELFLLSARSYHTFCTYFAAVYDDPRLFYSLIKEKDRRSSLIRFMVLADSVCTSDDLKNFIGDLSLATTVINTAELSSKFVSIVAS
mmetsp:Transcript_16349/g.19600  ORF Transcript_16349/g.19600 Transcript_16349/m.19600 type:complete len:89 (+) Transcript_16349:88-354(+)